MMAVLLNHIQGKNGSRWAKFIRDIGTDNLLMVAIDAAKYTHKAMICTYYGDILVKPFEFDASLTGLNKVKEQIYAEKDKHGMKAVVVGIETTGIIMRISFGIVNLKGIMSVLLMQLLLQRKEKPF